MEDAKQIIIVGPTASGKTGLAIDLAKNFNGQIISADSRAVYKGLDIGTAKPSLLERQGIVHYGFDLVYPDQRFSSMKFKQYATEKVKTIRAVKKLPIIVGGSGLYVDSYVFNYRPPMVDKTKTTSYEQLSVAELRDIIMSKNLPMPENSQNKLHLINAILRQGKKPQKDNQPQKGTLMIGIRPPKYILINNIRARCEEMFKNGVTTEARMAYQKYGYYAPGLRGGIYAELVEHFKYGADVNGVKTKFIKSDIYLAKRQFTWFKRNGYIKWFESANEAKNFLGLIN